jgi:hypothetical protein
VSRRQRCPSQSRERGHKDELRKRQDFADHAVGPEHQSGSKRDEVSSHMGREQTLQPKETRRIEEPSIEAQERDAEAKELATKQLARLSARETVKKAAKAATPAVVKPKPDPLPPTSKPKQLRGRVRASLLRRGG